MHKPELDAQLVAESIALQLEKRVAFRRAMRKAVDSALRFGCKGIKVRVSGRLNSAEIAVPSGTFRGSFRCTLCAISTTGSRKRVRRTVSSASRPGFTRVRFWATRLAVRFWVPNPNRGVHVPTVVARAVIAATVAALAATTGAALEIVDPRQGGLRPWRIRWQPSAAADGGSGWYTSAVAPDVRQNQPILPPLATRNPLGRAKAGM